MNYQEYYVLTEQSLAYPQAKLVSPNIWLEGSHPNRSFSLVSQALMDE